MLGQPPATPDRQRETTADCPALPRYVLSAGNSKWRFRESSPDVVKQLLDELIDRADISPDKQAQPFFWVPDEQRPGPSLARAL